jgi:hypothetical protein
LEVRIMPRLPESVPKYRRHRATGQAVVTINGRDIYLGPHRSRASKLLCDQKITEWLASARSPSYEIPEHVTSVAELVVAYIEHANRYYGDGPRSECANMRHALRSSAACMVVRAPQSASDRHPNNAICTLQQTSRLLTEEIRQVRKSIGRRDRHYVER